MTGLALLVPVLFGLALVVSLVTVILSMRRRMGAQDTRQESAAETWRTALPWLLILGVLLIVLPGLYWLTR